jgi:putative transposase
VTRHVDAQVKAVLVARLREQRAAGTLTSAEVRRAAAGMGVGERTVWGWLAVEPAALVRRPRARYEITEADCDAYAAWRGNIAAVHRALHAGRDGAPSLRRLQEAFARDLTPGERAAVVDGVEGRRRHEVYLRWAPNRRNALWEGDHTELPVLVIAPRAQRARKPWATLFIDGYSRLIMGWALSLYPTSAVVLAALRQGMVVDAARGPFGGLPEALRPDNGLEFVATALARSCAALGVDLLPTPPYTPHRKGKIERVNRTLDQEFLSGLPFYTHGPRFSPRSTAPPLRRRGHPHPADASALTCLTLVASSLLFMITSLPFSWRFALSFFCRSSTRSTYQSTGTTDQLQPQDTHALA